MEKLIDFHCHIDLYPNFEDIADSCEVEHIRTLAVTTTPRAWPRNKELSRTKKYVRAALGFHPQLVKQGMQEDLKLWEEYLPETRYVGEVGIDAGPDFASNLELQTDIFTYILKCCAAAGDKILTVHSVRSSKLVLDLVEAHFPSDRGRVVLHWFTGTRKDARRAIELGCYFSINTKMLETAKGQALLEVLPLERLLTETDGPFTQSHPRDVQDAIEELALAYRMPTHEIVDAIYANLGRLLADSDLR